MNAFTVLGFGVMIFVVGVTGIMFVYSENKIEGKIVELSDSYIIEALSVSGTPDIGFYKIVIDEFKETEIFVQVIDSKQNIIHDKKINTKMSVNYFDMNKNEEYEIILKNLSEDKITFEIEFGNLNYLKIILPGLMTLIGLIIIFGGALKIQKSMLKN